MDEFDWLVTVKIKQPVPINDFPGCENVRGLFSYKTHVTCRTGLDAIQAGVALLQGRTDIPGEVESISAEKVS